MSFEYEIKENVAESPGQIVVILSGELESESVQRFEKDLITLLDRGIRLIRIDMRDLNFCDSLALGSLVMFNRKARQRLARVDFIVVEKSPIHKLLTRSSVDKVFFMTVVAKQ